MEQEQEQERIVKGIWIPIEIWKNKDLTWNEKILFLEIDSYTSREKECFFSNEYIANLLGISETNANKTLSSLIQKGYVIKTKFDGRKRYVKSALSYSTTLPCQERQPSYLLYNNNSLINKDNNKEKDSKLSKKMDDLFEECWVAYNRKGSKKKSKDYWNKLSDDDKLSVLQHIRVYVSSRERQYQKDFERYLRDKTFKDIVSNGNEIVYDPTLFATNEYLPQGRGIWFNDDTKSYWSMDSFYDETIYDGYTDDNRPDGAQITLNNARGTYKWNTNSKKWIKQ